MISSTLGAPLRGTMEGGQKGLESLADSLITPPNFGGGGGIWSPWSVVVALGEPGVPVIVCAVAGIETRTALMIEMTKSIFGFIVFMTLGSLCFSSTSAAHPPDWLDHSR